MTLLLVALGAALGSPLRFAWGHLADGRLPLGTLVVNTLGCGLLGVFSGMALGGHAFALLGVGFCGALTTWSGLAVQAVERGPRTGGAYLMATLALGLGACFLGFLAAGGA